MHHYINKDNHKKLTLSGCPNCGGEGCFSDQRYPSGFSIKCIKCGFVGLVAASWLEVEKLWNNLYREGRGD